MYDGGPWVVALALAMLAGALLYLAYRSRDGLAARILRAAPRLAVTTVIVIVLAWWRGNIWTWQPAIVMFGLVALVAALVYGCVAWIEALVSAARPRRG